MQGSGAHSQTGLPALSLASADDLSDAERPQSPKLQLLGGPAEEKNLARYRELALADVSAESEEAIQASRCDELESNCVSSQCPSR